MKKEQMIQLAERLNNLSKEGINLDDIIYHVGVGESKKTRIAGSEYVMIINKLLEVQSISGIRMAIYRESKIYIQDSDIILALKKVDKVLDEYVDKYRIKGYRKLELIEGSIA